ncbi:MAG: hypothetical protein JWQ79_889 [Mucilaginibacter sp.]|jgi:hypothetical protein|nr:hypothetical protein [Mucilaginibacter sp.]
MKITHKTPAKDKKTGTKKASATQEIKTDLPLSEKDEVKKAEQKLRESQKKRG